MLRLTILIVAGSLLLGGATSSRHITEPLLQLLAIGFLAAAFWSPVPTSTFSSKPERMGGSSRLPAVLICIWLLALAWQLFPVWPVPIATTLGVAPVLASLPQVALEETDRSWPLATFPHESWPALLSVLPALATVALVSRLGAEQRYRLVLVVLAVGALGLLVGFMQVAQGPFSPLRLYDVTNPTEAVGFFANRNHFAALLYTMLVLAAVWLGEEFKRSDDRAKIGTTSGIITLLAAALLVAAVIGGLALARSRAGLALAMVALLGLVAILWSNKALHLDLGRIRKSRGFFSRGVVVLGIVAVGILIAAQFGLHAIQQRFSKDLLLDDRVLLAEGTLSLLKSSLPWGLGFGSFAPSFQMTEQTAWLSETYANRAHNDWLEFGLEASGLGFAMIALFAIWFVRRSYIAWTTPSLNGDVNVQLQRAATIVIPLLAAHSLVDYPLRTTAMLVVFAMTVALLVQPAPAPHREQTPADSLRGSRRSRRASGRQTPASRLAPSPARPSPSFPQLPDTPATPPAWGPGTRWPDAWKKPPKPLDG